MPAGLPPYPVAFKEFFITDPKTGKQTMRVQMFPQMNESSVVQEEESNEADIGGDEAFSNWLSNYYEHGAMYDYPDYDESYDVGPVHY